MRTMPSILVVAVVPTENTIAVELTTPPNAKEAEALWAIPPPEVANLVPAEVPVLAAENRAKKLLMAETWEVAKVAEIYWPVDLMDNLDLDLAPENQVALMTKMQQVCIFTIYRTRAIITRGLYTFYPLFEFQKRFSRVFFFLKFWPYVWLVFKNGF